MGRFALVVSLSLACVACRKRPPPSVDPIGVDAAPDPSASAPKSDSKPAVAKNVVAKTPSIGSLAGPATPTAARLKARSCAAGAPIDIGTGEGMPPAAVAGFGASSGLVVWSAKSGRLAARPIARNGKPTGEAHEVDSPASLGQSWGLHAVANHFVALMSKTDYSGSSPIMHLYAMTFAKDGAAVGSAIELDVENRGMIDSVSDGAENGFLVYAGATPATNVKTARLITVHVAADGTLSQSTRDYPDPTPGDRAIPKFSFSPEHVVVVLPNHVIVDGEIRDSKEDPDIEGLIVAPRFTGAKVPLIGYPKILEDTKRRYGTLTLDGKRTFEAKIDTKPALRAPFEETASWIIEAGLGEVSATALGKKVTLALPGLSSGIWTNVVWSGEQALVLYTAGPNVRLAPLPCN